MSRPLQGATTQRRTYAQSGLANEGDWHRRHREESTRLLAGWGEVLPTDIGVDGHAVLADMLAFSSDGFPIFLEVLDGPERSKLRRLIDMAHGLAADGAGLILVCNPIPAYPAVPQGIAARIPPNMTVVESAFMPAVDGRRLIVAEADGLARSVKHASAGPSPPPWLDETDPGLVQIYWTTRVSPWAECFGTSAALQKQLEALCTQYESRADTPDTVKDEVFWRVKELVESSAMGQEPAIVRSNHLDKLEAHDPEFDRRFPRVPTLLAAPRPTRT